MNKQNGARGTVRLGPMYLLRVVSLGIFLVVFGCINEATGKARRRLDVPLTSSGSL